MKTCPIVDPVSHHPGGRVKFSLNSDVFKTKNKAESVSSNMIGQVEADVIRRDFMSRITP